MKKEDISEKSDKVIFSLFFISFLKLVVGEARHTEYRYPLARIFSVIIMTHQLFRSIIVTAKKIDLYLLACTF